MEDHRHRIVFITSYPPRECGIATFGQDLITALKRLYGATFEIVVCALENEEVVRDYPAIVKYQLNVNNPDEVNRIIGLINDDVHVAGICLQHEFGLFPGKYGKGLLHILDILEKPLVTTFHTVLPGPDRDLKRVVKRIVEKSSKAIVMTADANRLLMKDYSISEDKMVVIPHGTHLVRWKQPESLKEKYDLKDQLVLSTFGLMGPNKNIETALKALPQIKKHYPTIQYLILGKTHPELVKREGEGYREKLENLVKELGLEKQVRFVNKYLSLEELLEYLQLTDIYLFTSKDPNQAVSGTFAYALSCACPIVSTPIPHAVEMLDENVGEIVPFEDHVQLAKSTIKLLSNDSKRSEMSLNAFHKTRATIWDNVAVSYAKVFESGLERKVELKYNLPTISLDHLKRMTIKSGVLQFSKLGIPDVSSGYTLDDNARALIAMVMHYKRFRQPDALNLIEKYFNFIKYCQRPDGRFYNYVDSQGGFHKQNHYTNLEDSNGRAIWALGFLVSNASFLPDRLVKKAIISISATAEWLLKFKSPRAMAFAIKGLYYHNHYLNNQTFVEVVEELSDRLVKCYSAESEKGWNWFEGYLTYANGVLPEALLLAYKLTDHEAYKEVAINSMDFLISKIFTTGQIKVISNRGWLSKGDTNEHFGEQPIDVAYTIMALDTFGSILEKNKYLELLTTAFEWFLGNNHLNQIIYNPASGGCYDGLEEDHPNLNEGAESTICYLLSRLVVEPTPVRVGVRPARMPQLPVLKARRKDGKISA